MFFLNGKHVVSVLLKRPLFESEEDEVFGDTGPRETILVRMCKRIEALYYVDRESFFKVKKNLLKTIERKQGEKWCYSLELLNCFLMVDKSRAKMFFSMNVANIDSYWLSFLLATSIGRDVDVALSAYEKNKLKLDSSKTKVYEKYLVSQKVGFGFSDMTRNTVGKNNDEKGSYYLPSLKIAVCVSGQLRGFESAKKSLDILFCGQSVDYYVHTWEKIGGVNKEAFKNKRVQPECLKNTLLSLKHNNPNAYDRVLSHALDFSGKISKLELARVYGKGSRIEVERDDLPISNSEKMYYKIKACFDLIESPDEYDLIIRVRPDLVVKEKKKVDWNAIHYSALNGVIFAGYGYNLTYYGFGVDDKFAIASPEKMRLYANFWEEKSKYSPIAGHSSLAAYLFDNKVDVVAMNDILKLEMNDARPINEVFVKALSDD